jgi:hypothetical protein
MERKEKGMKRRKREWQKVEIEHIIEKMKLYKAYYKCLYFKVINNPLFHICFLVHETSQCAGLNFYHEHGGSIILKKNGTHLPEYTVLFRKEPEYESSSAWKYHFSQTHCKLVGLLSRRRNGIY